MFDSITSLFGSTAEGTVVLECRNCGTTVESDADRCPHCGPETDIVRYEIR